MFLQQICKVSAEMVLSAVLDEGFEVALYFLDYELPVWDDLSTEERLEAIRYVKENKNNEDFSHSGLCKPVHQATAFFLVEWLKTQETEYFFDDLDFMADDMPVRFLK